MHLLCSYQLVNCPAVICSPNMLVIYHGETPLVNCGPGPSFTSEIQSTAFIYFLHFLQVTFIIHTIRLILCDQQAGEIDSLTVMLGQSFLVALCTGAVSSPTGSITLVSFLRENLLLHSSYLPLGVSQWTCDLHVSSTFSGAVAGDKRRICSASLNLPSTALFRALLPGS